MTARTKLTPDLAAERIKATGYEQLSPYVNRRTPVLLRCPVHGHEQQKDVGMLFRGQRLWCCGNADRSASHTGKLVSTETRAKLAARCGPLASGFGKSPSAAARTKQSAAMRAKFAGSIDTNIQRAATGQTAGRRGHFYIAILSSGELKFGSTTQPLDRRMSALRWRFPGARLLLAAQVADAGAYEAAMLERYREHWIGGERFSNFSGAAP